MSELSVRVRLVTALVMAGAVLTGCSGGSPDSKASLDPLESAAAAAIRNDEPVNVDAVQRFLVDCMKAAGFTYYPVPPAAGTSASLGLTDRQFKEQYGYGISTLIDYRQAQAAQSQADPNEAVTSAMSSSEQAAYQQAMSACDQRVIVELGAIPNGQLMLPSDSQVVGAINSALAGAQTDQRLVDVERQWTDCMRGQGFSYDSGEQLTAALNDQAGPFISDYTAQGQALVAAGRGWDTLTVNDVLTADQLSQLRQVQTLELAAAAADLVCADRGIDVSKVATDLQKEYLDKALDGI